MGHVMIDLETMGIRPSSVMVSLGAVFFDPDKLEIGSKWYGVFNIDFQLRRGATVDGSTILWWLGQEPEARAALAKNPVGLDVGLLSFNDWCRDHGPGPDKLKVWGNGSDFDNVILAGHYERMNYPLPWKFWNNRCFRTLKSLQTGLTKPVFRSGAHNALADAEYQVEWLLGIARTVRIG